AIKEQWGQVDPAADSGDYAGANKTLTDLKAKLDAYQKKLEELKQQKKAYEDALAPLQPRLQEASQSQSAKLAPMQQEIATGQQQMETAAQGEDYVQALKAAQDLATKLDAFEKARTELEQQKKEYEDALNAAQPKLTEASVSK